MPKLVAARVGVSRKLAFKTAVTHIIPIIERWGLLAQKFYPLFQLSQLRWLRSAIEGDLALPARFDLSDWARTAQVAIGFVKVALKS